MILRRGLLGVMGVLLPSLPVAAAGPAAEEVGQAIAARRDRVEELRLVREAAEELGCSSSMPPERRRGFV